MNLRIEQIFSEEMIGDKSFMQSDSIVSTLFGKHLYSRQDMREAWDMGIKHGIEIGLNRASLEGQQVELNRNATNNEHKDFLEKFYQLSSKYNCAIKYHPQLGMVVMNIKHNI